jgi:hypothetical protein
MSLARLVHLPKSFVPFTHMHRLTSDDHLVHDLVFHCELCHYRAAHLLVTLESHF